MRKLDFYNYLAVDLYEKLHSKDSAFPQQDDIDKLVKLVKQLDYDTSRVLLCEGIKKWKTTIGRKTLMNNL